MTGVTNVHMFNLSPKTKSFFLNFFSPLLHRVWRFHQRRSRAVTVAGLCHHRWVTLQRTQALFISVYIYIYNVCVRSGKGPQKEHYRTLIDSLCLEHVKICTPWLEPEDYPVLLGQSHWRKRNLRRDGQDKVIVVHWNSDVHHVPTLLLLWSNLRFSLSSRGSRPRSLSP